MRQWSKWNGSMEKIYYCNRLLKLWDDWDQIWSDSIIELQFIDNSTKDMKEKFSNKWFQDKKIHISPLLTQNNCYNSIKQHIIWSIWLEQIEYNENLMWIEWGAMWWEKWIGASMRNKREWPTCKCSLNVYHPIKNYVLNNVINELFPENWLLWDIVWDKHIEPASIYWSDWKSMICDNCVDSETHKNHPLKSIKLRMQNIVTELKKNLSLWLSWLNLFSIFKKLINKIMLPKNILIHQVNLNNSIESPENDSSKSIYKDIKSYIDILENHIGLIEKTIQQDIIKYSLIDDINIDSQNILSNASKLKTECISYIIKNSWFQFIQAKRYLQYIPILLLLLGKSMWIELGLNKKPYIEISIKRHKPSLNKWIFVRLIAPEHMKENFLIHLKFFSNYKHISDSVLEATLWKEKGFALYLDINIDQMNDILKHSKDCMKIIISAIYLTSQAHKFLDSLATMM